MQHKTPFLRTLAALAVVGLLTGGAAFAQVDLSRYVAVGDSLGAGFISGGLIDSVQAYSYPALLYRQANGTIQGFEMPLVSEPGIPSILQLAGLAPVTLAPAAGSGTPLNLFLQRPYSNLSVPGADITSVLETVTDGGGPHDLILRGLGTQLEQAIFQQPSFVTLWVNNDALGAATSGVFIEGVTITPAAEFDAKFRLAAGALASTGAQMLVSTIPDVTAIPFVTTIPPVLVDPATNQPVTIGGQFVPLLGPDGPLVPGRDFVLLTATAELAVGKGLPPELGGTGPLSTFSVLSGDEAAAINARIAQYNSTIRTVAGEVGAAVVDVNTIFNRIAAEGLEVGGIGYSTSYITGGLFSLDGVHPTPMGYAITANEMIAAINAHFGSNIPPVDLFPYIFGERGSASTGLPIGGSVNIADIVFTPKAAAQLNASMGVPPKRQLQRILRRIEQRRQNQGN